MDIVQRAARISFTKDIPLSSRARVAVDVAEDRCKLDRIIGELNHLLCSGRVSHWAANENGPLLFADEISAMRTALKAAEAFNSLLGDALLALTSGR